MRRKGEKVRLLHGPRAIRATARHQPAQCPAQAMQGVLSSPVLPGWRSCRSRATRARRGRNGHGRMRASSRTTTRNGYGFSPHRTRSRHHDRATGRRTDPRQRPAPGLGGGLPEAGGPGRRVRRRVRRRGRGLPDRCPPPMGRARGHPGPALPRTTPGRRRTSGRRCSSRRGAGMPGTPRIGAPRAPGPSASRDARLRCPDSTDATGRTRGGGRSTHDRGGREPRHAARHRARPGPDRPRARLDPGLAAPGAHPHLLRRPDAGTDRRGHRPAAGHGQESCPARAAATEPLSPGGRHPGSLA